MRFDDYKTYPEQKISPTILWEYDTRSPAWDWTLKRSQLLKKINISPNPSIMEKKTLQSYLIG